MIHLKSQSKNWPLQFTGYRLAPNVFVYWSIVSFIAVHVLAALKHATVDRDWVLHRMMPFARSD